MSPRTSLCMIVRDEAELLPACLDSVKGVVDEVIVVDTGSVDDTPAIARHAGATVVSFPWRDDFSAARNASLARATGDLVLVLDADERLAPGAGPALQAFGALPHPFGVLWLHNASSLDASAEDVLSGRARHGSVWQVPRLLRRTPDLAYEGTLHEHLSTWIHRHGGKGVQIDAAIIHLGAVPSLRSRRGKRLRNLRLLRARWEQDPRDLDAAALLAQELRDAGSPERAWSVIEAAWPSRHRATTITQRLTVTRALLLIDAGRPDEVLATLEDEEARAGRQCELAFVRGIALEQRATLAARRSAERGRRLDEARAAFEEALSPGGHRLFDSIQGARSYLARAHLGAVLLLLGRPAEAREAFGAALQESPTNLRAQLGMAEAELGLGDAPAALRRLEPLLGQAADAWWLAGCAADALGSRSDAALFFEKAREARAGFLAWHRAEGLEETLMRGGAHG